MVLQGSQCHLSGGVPLPESTGVMRSINQKLFQAAVEEWDVLTSLKSIRTASESLGLDGTLKYHQALSSFYSRTDQVNPDLHHSATEIKISCSTKKSCLCHPLISEWWVCRGDRLCSFSGVSGTKLWAENTNSHQIFPFVVLVYFACSLVAKLGNRSAQAHSEHAGCHGKGS